MAVQPLVSLGLLCEVPRSHSETPHQVGPLWTSDWTVIETLPDNTQHSKESDIHVQGGTRTRIPIKRAAAQPYLRPRDHWGR